MSEALEAMLARAQLPLTPEEHERMQRNWPIVQGWLEALRIPEARDAEPAVIFPAVHLPLPWRAEADAPASGEGC